MNAGGNQPPVMNGLWGPSMNSAAVRGYRWMHDRLWMCCVRHRGCMSRMRPFLYSHRPLSMRHEYALETVQEFLDDLVDVLNLEDLANMSPNHPQPF